MKHISGPQLVLHPVIFTAALEAPFVANLRQLGADLIGKGLTERQSPLPSVDPLCGSTVADHNAACGQDLVDMAQAEREAEIEPDGEAADLGWEAVSGVAGRGRAWSSDPATQPDGPFIVVPAIQLDSARSGCPKPGFLVAELALIKYDYKFKALRSYLTQKARCYIQRRLKTSSGSFDHGQ